MGIRNHRHCALIRVARSYKYDHVTTTATPIKLAIQYKQVLMANKETGVPQHGKLCFVSDVVS